MKRFFVIVLCLVATMSLATVEAKKKKITDMQSEMQKIVDAYNKDVPTYKRIVRIKLRDVEFEKNTTKKIKRF